MVKKLGSIVVAALLALSFVGSVLADEIKGKITKVDGGGREITVKGKDKEVKVSISSSRTAFEGIGGRGDLKEGLDVTVEYADGAAKKVSVKKAK
ncbi:MAG: hypothetical protein A3F90_14135 [Deltaproteobacteria bacterium RIFCSPLOWO2_12_FULL_60_19]|nr:MAG: hypothetical protein A3F90_14135 [Deltaproteobacteria bacterium RIFCSPLOWO2_12_FULL_60_19]